jgi:hypothetical protein
MRRRRAFNFIEQQLQRVPTWAFVSVVVIVLSAVAIFVNPEGIPQSSKEAIQIIFSSAESIAIAAAVALYFKEIPDRKERKHYEAWQVIDKAAAAKLPTSYARRKALEDLYQDGVPFSGIDLPNADLQFIDFRDANLRGADLSGADLTLANFSRTVLRGAKLSDANLGDTKLVGADLVNADLQRARGPADIRKAQLNNANMRDASLGGSRFNQSNLSRANLSGANLQFADFRGANLSYSDPE